MASAAEEARLAALRASLAAQVERGDAAGCVALLLGQKERTRRALGEWAAALLNQQYQSSPRGSPPAATAKLLALATATEKWVRDWIVYSAPPQQFAELAAEVIAARWPAGSPAGERIVAAIYGGGYSADDRWRLSCALEERGYGRGIDDDTRIAQFVFSIPAPDGQAPRLASTLRADPALHRFVWRLFEAEEAARWLQQHDDYCAGDLWLDGLVALAADGTLARDRLLDATLDALAVERPVGSAWFAELHEKLLPTLDERARRLDRYLRLMSTRGNPALETAHAVAAALIDSGALPPERLYEAIAPALSTKSKPLATRFVRLLDKAAARAPGTAPQAAHAAVSALAHTAPEVQAAALAVITRLADARDAALVERLRSAVDHLAPSNQAELSAWLAKATTAAGPAIAGVGAAGGAAVELADLIHRARAVGEPWRRLAGIDAALAALSDGVAGVAAIALNPLAVPRLVRPLAPIVRLEELVDGALAAIEGGRPADELERVVDGIARLCRLRPPDFEALAAPLRRRAIDRVTEAGKGTSMTGSAWPFVGQSSLVDLMALVVVWLESPGEREVRWEGESLDWRQLIAVSVRALPANMTSPVLFLSTRLKLLAQRVSRGRAIPLLSTPTHLGGFIDPRVLVQRALAGTDLTDAFDQILALHRLAPEHRAEALADAGPVAGEFGAALRHALGGDEAIGPTAALWFAAARARSPLGDDALVEARHPGGGPNAAQAARYSIDPPGFPRPGRITYGALFGDARGCVGIAPSLPFPVPLGQLATVCQLTAADGDTSKGWASTLWPLSRAPILAREAQRVSLFIDSEGAYWHGDWEPLFDADEPLGVPGAMLVALGLAVRHPARAKLAEDALVAAIDDGRLDGEMLGAAMAAVLGWGALTVSRWTRALSEVARLSALHLAVVRDALERALGDAAPAPRTVLALVELLREWSAASGEPVTHAATRAWLAAIDGGGKVATLARVLLAAPAKDPAAHRREAAARALEQRVERAQRWQQAASAPAPDRVEPS